MKTVERGVALLDERMPGWDEKIDLEKLDLASTCNCIVGQLMPLKRGSSRFDRGIKKLGVDHAHDYGFDTGYGGRGYQSYDRLTAAWRRLIKRRRKERAA